MLPALALAGQGILIAGRFLLPRIVAATPTVLNAARTTASALWTTTKALVSNPITRNPIKTVVGLGIANQATDGAVGEVGLRVGEGAAKVAGAVVGKEAVTTAAKAVVGATVYAGEGLAKAGASAVKRYGPEALEHLPPLGRVGAVVKVAEGAAGTARDKAADAAGAARGKARDVVAEGGIAIDKAQEAGARFKDKATEVAGDAVESIEDMTGGLIDAAELKRLGDIAAREAKTNRWVQAGLLFGGLQGAMSANSNWSRGPKAAFMGIFMAAIFAFVGHYGFGQRSELVQAASDKISKTLGHDVEGITGAPSARLPAPALRRSGTAGVASTAPMLRVTPGVNDGAESVRLATKTDELRQQALLPAPSLAM